MSANPCFNLILTPLQCVHNWEVETRTILSDCGFLLAVTYIVISSHSSVHLDDVLQQHHKWSLADANGQHQQEKKERGNKAFEGKAQTAE